MAEWLKAHAWKACRTQVHAGSNPVLSAKNKTKMNNYNFSIKHREEFDVSSQRIWDIISEPSNLNHYHPFCKNNDIISWDGENHHDRLEYLNGVVIERKFISWDKNNGYDLFIGRKNGRQSHVSWRIEDISENKSALTIKVHPWIINQGSKVLQFIPFQLFVKPQLKLYLKSVLRGLKWYTKHNKPTPRNHFGKLAWFS